MVLVGLDSFVGFVKSQIVARISNMLFRYSSTIKINEVETRPVEARPAITHPANPVQSMHTQ